MSDELNPYPGNLKHHKVDAPARREPLFGHQDGYTCSSFFGKECDCDVSIYEEYRAKDAELIQRLVDAGDVMKQWLGLTLQMDGESCPDCGYDWGKGHNYGCAQLQHQKSIDEWDAAKTAGFKPSDQ